MFFVNFLNISLWKSRHNPS